MIKSIVIKNYRGIKDLEIDNFKKYNFFIGDNGSKKTTILESLGIGLSLLDFERILKNARNRKMKIKKENVSSLFFNSDTNNMIKFILETKDNIKAETVISIDKTLSMFQDFSSDEINNDFSNYFYTIEKRIREDKLKTNIYIKENNQTTYKNFRIETIPKSFKRFLEKYNISIEISDNLKNSSDTIFQVDRIIKSRKKEELLKYLQIIDKDIKEIYINDEEIFVEKETLKEFIPISSIGDGMVLALDIISSLILTDDFRVILIDEIERGIYYKNYRKLSEIIIELCKDNQNIQLFITTHSKEFLEAFNEALFETEKDNFSLFSLRNKKEKLDVVHYTSEELKDTLETGWDPR
ncbi:recombination protein F [Fusobacterium polymorphum]|jgi:possible ATP binding protein|uniref:Possible ATP binding protein n=1 Tax=Fusobacterium polymorphum ATCC 10953 TaxID=393480 RepID=A5TRS3_FUSNP|nr:AAA family ATPase [Fusobacterium polymorphum]EDK87598.1 possible ATP binding protein [Fusobacterium polymorphum ATCC 10953]UTI52906.1 AAA family ATPase [Fusobacterium polymorphum]WRL67422.1 AAA family ATPase [Fusobacterium polymorphum]CKH16307.1 recombination protein F [Fusobacterium polymorphum]